MNDSPVARPANFNRFMSLRLVAVVTGIDAVYFSLTEPNAGNSLMLIAGIGLLAISVYVWVGLAVRCGAAFWPTPARGQRRLTTFLAVVVMVLILMQSIGQLSWRDFAAIIPFAVAFYVYLAYLTPNVPEAR